jgi:glycosyltransferase involved in cell wall biosynthesis
MPRIGAAADYIGRAGAARLSQPAPADFAVAVIALLHDAAARSQLADRARQLAATELSWSAVARRLLSFYDEWRNVPAARGSGGAASGSVP